MKFIFFILASVAFFSGTASATLSLPTPPPTEARSYIVVDVDSNQILAEHDANRRVEPASTTKLMTAYLTFQALKSGRLSLDQRIPVSESVWKKPGSSMYIDPRMNVPVDDLIKGMLVQSGNDATNLLAETIGGTVDGFVPMMNIQANMLGMKSTTFRNPEGLPTPGHLTTARDLAILGMSILRDFPEYAHYFSIKHYYYPGTPPSNGTNRNQLLFRDPTVDGMKTGHTDSAGYCLVASASRSTENFGMRRIITVVLGATSERQRANETEKLLNWGFRAYDPVRLSLTESTHETQKIWKGKKDSIEVGIESTSISVPSGQTSNIEYEYKVTTPLVAPIAKGDKVGTFRVTLSNTLLLELPVKALEDVEEANFVIKIWDTLILFFKDLFS